MLKSVGSPRTGEPETLFIPVSDEAILNELIARSYDEPVVIFKHSVTCPISAAAYEEMLQLGREVALIVVQSARDVSRQIEARTGVRHETPQTIILRKGQAVWSASHWDVTADRVADALRLGEEER
jgi:bacillithiol system protein YtxJ